jgi:rRNA biogenesis protein RRP5
VARLCYCLKLLSMKDCRQLIQPFSRTPSRSSKQKPNTSPYSTGTFVLCRVLEATTVKSVVDVSLRQSRIDGDLDEDDTPESGDLSHAYVVDTNKKGCFLRLSRRVEGRVTLKELSDGFLPDPSGSFPCGRLVVGKVKAVKPGVKGKSSAALPLKMTAFVDLDLRESVISTIDKLKFEDVAVGSKHKGRVSRIEDYGVFVKLENSDLSGLSHKSECSDNFIRNLSSLYEPGDLVKVLVLKKDEENRKLGFSMKASHFENDPDSDDDSDDSIDDDVLDQVNLDEIASDDENYVKKLASRLETDAVPGDEESSASSASNDAHTEGSSATSDDSSSASSDGSDSDDDEDGSVDEHRAESRTLMDTDVGFDWGGAAPSSKADDSQEASESDSDDSELSVEADDSGDRKRSHKSKRKHAQRMREEQELVRRETALADGTADENPETAADFERQLVSNPNSSELWIKVCVGGD